MMMQRRWIVMLGVALAGEMALAENESWAFALEPYLLAASIEGDAGVGRVTGAEVDAEFSDLLETLSFGAMVRFDGRHGSGWGFTLDYFLADLEADTSTPRGGVIDANVRQAVLEALVVRQFDVGDGELEGYFGLRRWDNEVDVRVDPAILPGDATAGLDEDWIDPVIGMRFERPIAERWSIAVRADIGGFGIESDFTWGAAGTLLYAFSDRFVLEFGYEALGVDYESGDAGSSGYFAYDTTSHGPLAGLSWRF